MKLSEIVVKDAILPKLSGETRDEVIAELIDGLVEADAVQSALREEFIESILKREKGGTTGFGHGVAIPHIKHPAIETLAVAVGISQVGIDFNALDQQPVFSIFLLLSPEEKPEEHVDAMRSIFANLNKDQFRRFLRQADTVEDVVTLIEEADAEQTVH